MIRTFYDDGLCGYSLYGASAQLALNDIYRQWRKRLPYYWLEIDDDYASEAFWVKVLEEAGKHIHKRRIFDYHKGTSMARSSGCGERQLARYLFFKRASERCVEVSPRTNLVGELIPRF